jgi:hypothetical protein
MRQKKQIRSRKQEGKYKLFAAIFTLSFSLSVAMAQEATPSSGSNASGSGGSVSWSVGQVACQTHTGTNGSVTEGVLQPYEISVITGIEGAKSIKLSVTAYPNPATDYLILEVKDFELSTLTFQLYDMNGKLLQSEKITGNKTRIVIDHLVPANYLVKVTQGNKEIKTFKVIKN